MRGEAPSLAERLSAVHRSWFGDIGEPLLQASLRSHLGRRLLVRQLAEAGFGLAWMDERRSTAARAALCPGKVRRMLLELGAHAYATPIREVVEREPARRLRRVLGPFYACALENRRPAARLSPAQCGEFRIRLATALGSGDEQVVNLLVRQGQREVHLHAQDDHPALAEWVRLLCPRSEQAPVAITVLPDALVARVRARHIALDEEEAA
ncbi:MAG: hypothetical protein ACXIUZ_06110 [Lysobacteraceae bacterium]